MLSDLHRRDSRPGRPPKMLAFSVPQRGMSFYRLRKGDFAWAKAQKTRFHAGIFRFREGFVDMEKNWFII